MVNKGERTRGGINWEFGINIYTLLYMKQITNKDLLYSTVNYIQYLIITCNGQESDKRIHIYIYITESLCCTPETNTTQEINYTSIKNKFKKFYIILIFLINLFLFLAALSLHCCGWAFSSRGEREILFIAVCRLLIAVSSLVAEHGLQVCGLQQLWHVGSVVVAHGLQSAGSVVVAHGLVAPRHVGSSRTRARTHVPCIGRRILNHCTTPEDTRFSAVNRCNNN